MNTKISSTNKDLILIACIAIISFIIFGKFDVLEKIVEMSAKYEEYEVDEIISTSIVFTICLVWFAVRRWRESITSNKDLQNALNKIKTLEGIIPICMYCKEIRDDKGAWNQLELYISEHSEAHFSHSICEKCLEERFPEQIDQNDPAVTS